MFKFDILYDLNCIEQGICKIRIQQSVWHIFNSKQIPKMIVSNLQCRLYINFQNDNDVRKSSRYIALAYNIKLI